jgi:WD40 repeat protein
MFITVTAVAGIPADIPGAYQDLETPGMERTICVLQRVDGGFDQRLMAAPAPAFDRAVPGSRVAGEMWRVEDWDGAYGAIAEDVQISGNGQRIFTAWNLNYERFSLFPISNDTPLWEYALTDASTQVGGYVRVAIADDGMSMVGGASRIDTIPVSGEYSKVFRFSSGAVPDWTFDLPTDPEIWHLLDVAMSGDGSTVGVLAIDNSATTGLVYVLDGVSGALLHQWDFDYAVSSSIYNIDFSGDTSRLVVGCRNLIHVYDIPSGLLQTITLAYDCQCPARITPDANYIAVGNLRGRLTVYQLAAVDGQPDAYTEYWTYTIPPDYYYPWIQTVDVADDSSRVVLGSYQPNQTSNHGYLYFFDMDGSTPQWSSEDSGGLVQAVACSANGTVACAGSWGDLDGAMGWCCLIAKDNGARYTLSSVDYGGSLFAADIDDPGYFAAGGSKRVHAYEFGSGGHTFAMFSGIKVETFLIDLASTPTSGTLPTSVIMHVTLTNLTLGPRTCAGHVDLITAGGRRLNNLRQGFANVPAGDVVRIDYPQKLPALGTLIGDNTFILSVQDVTAAPYNQPPYYPEGDKDLDTTIVEGIYGP